jgi:hypothetical protein
MSGGGRMTRGSNLFIRLALAAIIGSVLAVSLGGFAFAQSDYVSRVGFRVDQPVPFSHQHHAGGLGIDCRYCHVEAETSVFAGIPSATLCMNCHSQLYTSAEMLEPVRASAREGRPIAWQRVHDLPDYVYFNHSVHVQAGVACATCHGQVERMPLMWKEHSLAMQWCLDCHKHPMPESGVPAEAEALTSGAAELTNCTTCHR